MSPSSSSQKDALNQVDSSGSGSPSISAKLSPKNPPLVPGSSTTSVPHPSSLGKLLKFYESYSLNANVAAQNLNDQKIVS